MKNRLIISVLIIILLILIATILWLVVRMNDNKTTEYSPYSAVYLSNGEIYFGRLSWFPSPKLKNVFFIQNNQDDENPGLSLQSLKSAFWGPADEIQLNSKEIIFWAKLRSDSQVASLIDQQINNSNLQTSPQN